MRLVKIGENTYVNPAYVISVTDNKKRTKVWVKVLQGKYNLEIESDYALEQTVEILTK